MPLSMTEKTSFVATAGLGILAATLAFVLAQGLAIGVPGFFTPIHHDDFTALAGSGVLDLWQPRPVSSNFLYVFGAYGPGFLYGLYFCLWMLCFPLVVMLAFHSFQVTTSPEAFALTTFFTVFGWLSLGASVANLQYLGLSTNGVSLLFAVLAALTLLGGQLSVFRLGGFLVFLVLTAFAKEDMVAFLAGVVLLWSVRAISAGVGVKASAVRAASLLAAVAVVYGLSILHSRLVGSAFTAGSGYYDLSSPFENVVRNSLAFWNVSFGLQVVIALNVAALIALGIRAAIVRSWSSIGDLIAAALPFAMVLPYVMLPRFADYYACSFAPLMIAIQPPVTIRLLRAGGPMRVRGLAVGTPAVIAIALNASDVAAWYAQMAWYDRTRDVSRHQLQELERADADDFLKQCSVVAVTGVSENIGAFLAGNSKFLDRFVGEGIRWQIEAVPGTVLGSFATATTISDPEWQYFSSSEEAAAGADCRVDFSQDGRADFAGNAEE